MPLVKREALGRNEIAIGDALHNAHIDVFGGPALLDRLAMAWAQVCQETARGAALWNGNVGNITCRSTDPVDYISFRTTEYAKGDGKGAFNATMYFRAYPSLEAGAADYWRKMAGRYAKAFALFDDGNAVAVAKKLSDLKYYTGSSEVYARNMSALYHEFMRKHSARYLSVRPPPPLPAPGNDGGGESA